MVLVKVADFKEDVDAIMSDAAANAAQRKIIKVIRRFSPDIYNTFMLMFPIMEQAVHQYLDKHPDEALTVKEAIQIRAAAFVMEMNKLCDIYEEAKVKLTREEVSEIMAAFSKVERQSVKKYLDETFKE